MRGYNASRGRERGVPTSDPWEARSLALAVTRLRCIQSATFACECELRPLKGPALVRALRRRRHRRAYRAGAAVTEKVSLYRVPIIFDAVPSTAAIES